MAKKNNRRDFLNKLGIGCASIGATSLLSGITNLGLVNSAAAANANNSFFNPSNNDYKALVCILLAGGNDSFNMLIPRGTTEYNEYAQSRTNVAIPQNQILPINPNTSDGKQYGVHPSMPKIQSLFEAGNLAFISNIGALVYPTTMSDFNTGFNLPEGLFSHSDQQKHWQTSLPQDRQALTGWGGRMADILRYNNASQSISMNLSLSGLNQFQLGDEIQPYSILRTGSGAVQISGSTSNNFYNTIKRQTLDSLLEENYINVLDQAFQNTITNSNGNSFEFSGAINSVAPFTTTFADTNLSESLQMVAKTIAARDVLNVSQQTFFISFGGWDTHDYIIDDHAELLATLDDAMDSFYSVLAELGLENNVTTFTMSDFGRKLVSNGDGSDHGWGGNVMVMGGAVNGKDIYGSYPDLYLGSPLDTGTGRFIPTTSCDEYFAELALWFGASSADLYQIFPNITNFWTPNSTNYPIGFMS